jgi:hypothetical protein
MGRLDEAKDSQQTERSIFNVLTREHREMSHLMQQIERSVNVGGDAAERAELFSRLRSALVAHGEAEDRVVYAYFAISPRMEPKALQAREEHRLIEHMFDDMEAIDVCDTRWYAKFCVLRELFEHHVEDEESEQFKIAKRVMDEDESARLAEAFLATRRELTQHTATVAPAPAHTGRLH